MSHTLIWRLYDTAPKNALRSEQKNDAEMKLLQGTCAICDSVSLEGKNLLFRDADLILGYINQGDDMTAHPHSEHRVQIQLLNFGKDAARLDRVQNKARSTASLAEQEGSNNGARFIWNRGEWMGGEQMQPCVPVCILMYKKLTTHIITTNLLYMRWGWVK